MALAVRALFLFTLTLVVAFSLGFIGAWLIHKGAWILYNYVY